MTRAIALAVIRLYQLIISPLLGPTCRFSPSCSEYSATSIQRFGLLRGSWLGIKRISRCHPWGHWGYDPPPELEEHTCACISQKTNMRKA